MPFHHCGDPEFLQSALAQQLTEAERTEFELHLETCELCQRTIDQLAAGAVDPQQLADSLRSGGPAADSALLDALPRMKGESVSSDEAADHTALDFLAPSDDAGSLGRLGVYEIHDVVGRGGMGVVLRGFDRKLDRVVAIKVLAPELAANATARRRFLREAKAAAAISHSQVVTIFAVEDSERLPYLVMEYVDGQSLQAKLDRQGPLELKEILRVGLQTAAGLAAAHAQGLIHRDIKPGNILLENGVERVRITDFGLARAVDDAGVTRTGEVAGTPTYMSPEQARGGRVDQRSDLFSLGSVLYAMCTGRSPFRADSTIAVIRRVCDDTPRPIREINPDIPPWLVAIVDRLLAKRPEDRIQTAAEVAELLGRHLAHLHDPDSPPPSPLAPLRRRRPLLRRWLIAAVLLLAVLGGLGLAEVAGVTRIAQYVMAVLGIPGDASEPPFPTKGVVATAIDGVDLLKRIDPKRHAVQGNWRFEQETLVSPATGRWDRIAVPYNPPEEYDLEVTAERKQGGDMLCIALVSGSRQFFVGLDMFAGRVSGLGLIDGKDAFANETTREQPIFEDGLPHKILCQVRTGGVKVMLDGEPLIEWLGDLDRLSLPAEGKTDRLGLCVTHSCYHIYDMVLRPAGQVAEPTAAIVEVRRFEGHTGPVKQVAFSPDGKLALSGSGIRGDGAVRLWEVATGREIRSLKKPVGAIMAVCFSHDGRLAAAGGMRGVVYLWEVDTGRQITALQTSTELLVVDLAFSPDDRQLLGVARKRMLDPTAKEIADLGTAQLWDTKTDEVVWRFDSEGGLQSGDFLSDSRRVVVAGMRAGGAIHVLDRETGNELERWQAPGGEAEHVEELAVSPDGRFVATAARNGILGLWDVQAGGALIKSQKYTSRLHTVAFSPDSRWLLTGGSANSIWLLDVARLRTIAAVDHPSGLVWHIAVSPDGRHALSAGGNDGDELNGDYALRLWQLPQIAWPKEAAAAAGPGAFVVLGPENDERRFDTLAEAVAVSTAGDTIEIHGNGPFVTDPLYIYHALTIRAANGFRPVIRLGSGAYAQKKCLLWTEASLVLEGLSLERTPPSRSKEIWGYIVFATRGATVHASNCRFLNLRGSCLKGWNLDDRALSVPPVATLRNCEFLSPLWPGETCQWHSTAHGRLVFENCVHTSRIDMRPRPSGAMSVYIELRSNTMAGVGVLLDLDELSDDLDPQQLGPPVRVDASGNVFGARALIIARQTEPTPSLLPADAEALLPQLIQWDEQQNVHPAPEDLLRGNPPTTDLLLWIDPGWKQLRLKRGRDLPDWNELWGQPKTESIQDKVFFAGGDLSARAESDPAQLTAEDFRLRPDSPGHCAGPDGKDLGADVDLVGPGDAYERWKMTPEYQAWLTETRELMDDARPQAPVVREPGAFVVLAPQDVERKFNTLAEAVAGSGACDTIEIRGDGPFVTDPVTVNHALVLRAGEGFKPVLLQDLGQQNGGKPLVLNRAPLVVEGITLKRWLAAGTPHAGAAPWGTVVTSQPRGALYLANCRLLNVRGACLMLAADATCRNCELLMPPGDGSSSRREDGCAVRWSDCSGKRSVLANCILDRYLEVVPNDDFQLALELTGNTLLNHGISFTLGSFPQEPLLEVPRKALVSVDARQNLWGASKNIVNVSHNWQSPTSPTVQEVEAALRRIVDWRERLNAYPSDRELFAWYSGQGPAPWDAVSTRIGADLEAWLTFWKLAETGSVTGTARFAGGDVLKKIAAVPLQVTPEDFRLRPGSVGYRAGPDGKDLGADVDLVGPGEAYERWKKTPDYGQWVKVTNELMHSGISGTHEGKANAAADAKAQPKEETGEDAQENR